MDLLLAHPDLQAVIEGGPRTPIPSARQEGTGVGQWILIAFAGWALSMVLRSGVSGPQGPLFLIMVIPPVLTLMRRRDRAQSFPGAPVEAIPSRLSEATEPWGRTQEPRPRALLATHTGPRHLRLRRDLIGKLGVGTYGVAFVKADVLIDFQTLPIA